MDSEEFLARLDEKHAALKGAMRENFKDVREDLKRVEDNTNKIDEMLRGKSGTNGIAGKVKTHELYWKITLGVLTLLLSATVGLLAEKIKSYF